MSHHNNEYFIGTSIRHETIFSGNPSSGLSLIAKFPALIASLFFAANPGKVRVVYLADRPVYLKKLILERVDNIQLLRTADHQKEAGCIPAPDHPVRKSSASWQDICVGLQGTIGRLVIVDRPAVRVASLGRENDGA